MRRPVTLALVLAAMPLPALAAPPLAPAPVFPRGTTVDTIQGTAVADPYRALETWDDPAVKAWSDAENVRTRAWLDAIPGRQAVASRIRATVTATSPFYFGLQPRPNRIFAIYSDPAQQQPSLVTLAPGADPATRRTLLDPNTLAPVGHVTIDKFEASPDGSKVAVSLSANGSEDGTLHVFDVATLKEIEPPIDRFTYPTGGGSLAWAGDGSGFWYTRYPDASAPESERHFNLAVYWHKLGTPLAADKLVLSAKDGVPRTGEVFLDNSGHGASALANVQLGDGGQWRHWVLTPDGRALPVSQYEDRVIGGAVIARDGTLYGVSRLGAPKGRIVHLVAPYAGGFARAQSIIAPEAEAAVVDGGEHSAPVLIAGDKLLVTRVSGGPSTLTAYGLDGSHPVPLELPALPAVGDVAALPGGGAMVMVNTWTKPARYLAWTGAGAALAETPLRMTSPTSYDDAEVRRIFATSKDGTKVPVTVIMKKGTPLDGSRPLLLYGYGGYGVNMLPSFSGWRVRMILNAGGIYALANIRGGGEYGQEWHEQGMLTRKQNVFDDFAAAGETLIAQHYTSPAKLGLMGGSNGGLLMGAMITQHPSLARAVVSQVGIYDMMRVELDPNGAFNITEFGSVKDPAQFRALYAYSPYHHVVAGTKYPAMLFTTGANDGRVNPLNSRKFVAALQAASSSGEPILLRTSTTSGHGIGNSLDDTIAEGTDVMMFLCEELGMDPLLAAGAAK